MFTSITHFVCEITHFVCKRRGNKKRNKGDFERMESENNLGIKLKPIILISEWKHYIEINTVDGSISRHDLSFYPNSFSTKYK